LYICIYLYNVRSSLTYWGCMVLTGMTY